MALKKQTEGTICGNDPKKKLKKTHVVYVKLSVDTVATFECESFIFNVTPAKHAGAFAHIETVQ